MEPHLQSDASLPASQKWIWAIGGLAENFIGLGILFLGMNIYNLGFGISATLVGVVLAAPRLIDVIIDPLIGNISDNARTRWGRRRPFILVGGVIAATFFVLQWSPPSGWSQQGLFFYFLATTVLCFFGYAIFTIPFNAMGLEMANDYNERTRIQSAKYLFLIISQMLGSSSADNWKAAVQPKGGTSEPVRADDIDGMHTLAFVANFTTDAMQENRASWDWNGSLDLSLAESIDFEAITDEGEILKQAAIYFETDDGGWYVKCWVEIPDSWTDQSFLFSSFAAEGEPKDWSKVTKIRISTWSATPGRGILRLRNLRISGKKQP